MAGVGEASAIWAFAGAAWSFAEAITQYVDDFHNVPAELEGLDGEIKDTVSLVSDLRNLVAKNETTRCWSDEGVRRAQKCILDCQSVLGTLRNLLQRAGISTEAKVTKEDLDLSLLAQAKWPIAYKQRLIDARAKLDRVYTRIQIAQTSYLIPSGPSAVEKEKSMAKLAKLLQREALAEKTAQLKKDKRKTKKKKHKRGAEVDLPFSYINRSAYASNRHIQNAPPQRRRHSYYASPDASSTDDSSDAASSISGLYEELCTDLLQMARDQIASEAAQEQAKEKALQAQRQAAIEAYQAYLQRQRASRDSKRQELRAQLDGKMAPAQIDDIIATQFPDQDEANTRAVLIASSAGAKATPEPLSGAEGPFSTNNGLPTPNVPPKPKPTKATRDSPSSSRFWKMLRRKAPSAETAVNPIPSDLREILSPAGRASLRGFVIGSDGDEKMRPIEFDVPEDWLIKRLSQRDKSGTRKSGTHYSPWDEFALLPQSYRRIINDIMQDQAFEPTTYSFLYVLLYVERIFEDERRFSFGRKRDPNLKAVYIVLKPSYASEIQSNGQSLPAKEDARLQKATKAYSKDNHLELHNRSSPSVDDYGNKIDQDKVEEPFDKRVHDYIKAGSRKLNRPSANDEAELDETRRRSPPPQSNIVSPPTSLPSSIDEWLRDKRRAQEDSRYKEWLRDQRRAEAESHYNELARDRRRAEEELRYHEWHRDRKRAEAEFAVEKLGDQMERQDYSLPGRVSSRLDTDFRQDLSNHPQNKYRYKFRRPVVYSDEVNIRERANPKSPNRGRRAVMEEFSSSESFIEVSLPTGAVENSGALVAFNDQSNHRRAVPLKPATSNYQRPTVMSFYSSSEEEDDFFDVRALVQREGRSQGENYESKTTKHEKRKDTSAFVDHASLSPDYPSHQRKSEKSNRTIVKLPREYIDGSKHENENQSNMEMTLRKNSISDVVSTYLSDTVNPRFTLENVDWAKSEQQKNGSLEVTGAAHMAEETKAARERTPEKQGGEEPPASIDNQKTQIKEDAEPETDAKKSTKSLKEKNHDDGGTDQVPNDREARQVRDAAHNATAHTSGTAAAVAATVPAPASPTAGQYARDNNGEHSKEISKEARAEAVIELSAPRYRPSELVEVLSASLTEPPPSPDSRGAAAETRKQRRDSAARAAAEAAERRLREQQRVQSLEQAGQHDVYTRSSQQPSPTSPKITSMNDGGDGDGGSDAKVDGKQSPKGGGEGNIPSNSSSSPPPPLAIPTQQNSFDVASGGSSNVGPAELAQRPASGALASAPSSHGQADRNTERTRTEAQRQKEVMRRSAGSEDEW